MSGILDLLGFDNGGGSYFLRDFKNAYRFRPDVNPPRQQFNGYVNFILNRSLFNNLIDDPSGGPGGDKAFGTTISSLVRTAELPSVDFQTEIKNSYNRKKIIQTGVTYNPVSMTVFDTIGNEWLTVLMKYFAYHFMDPRNKQDGTSRDIEGSVDRRGGFEVNDDGFGAGSLWDSNRAGINAQIDPHFFERIDIVLYHGQKLVQYSLHNPKLSSFKPSSIDYASSEAMGFDLAFDYERFTTYSKFNEDMSPQDLERFDKTGIQLKGELFEKQAESKDTIFAQLGNTDLDPILSGRPRSAFVQANAGTPVVEEEGSETESDDGTGQEAAEAPPAEAVSTALNRDDPNLLATYGSAALMPSAADLAEDDSPGGIFGEILDTALTSLISGGNVKENTLRVVQNRVINATVQERGTRFNDSDGGGE